MCHPWGEEGMIQNSWAESKLCSAGIWLSQSCDKSSASFLSRVEMYTGGLQGKNGNSSQDMTLNTTLFGNMGFPFFPFCLELPFLSCIINSCCVNKVSFSWFHSSNPSVFPVVTYPLHPGKFTEPHRGKPKNYPSDREE